MENKNTRRDDYLNLTPWSTGMAFRDRTEAREALTRGIENFVGDNLTPEQRILEQKRRFAILDDVIAAGMLPDGRVNLPSFCFSARFLSGDL